MSYYMRFISTDSRPISLADIETALKDIDPKYSIKPPAQAMSEREGELRYGRALYAILDVVHIGQDKCEDLEDLRAEIADTTGDAAEQVRHALDHATDVLTLEVKWQGRSTEKTLQKIDPIWEWLTANRQGFAQADAEGYYKGTDLIIEVAAAPPHRTKVPPCPHCGQLLRTPLAQQCFECGADWHAAPGGQVL